MREPCNCQCVMSSCLIWGNLVTVNVKCLHVIYDTYGPPIPYMEQVSWSPTCTYCPPTYMVLPYLIWNRYLMVPPYLIWNMYDMVSHMYIWSPHMYDMIFSGQLRKSPLRVLMIKKSIKLWLTIRFKINSNCNQIK